MPTPDLLSTDFYADIDRMNAHPIGRGEDEAPAVRSGSERLMRIDGMADNEALIADMMGAIMEFAAVIVPIADERRATPRDDLLSIWANGELDGCPIEQSVMVQETGLFISGGAETTRTVIARGLLELTRHPDQWEA